MTSQIRSPALNDTAFPAPSSSVNTRCTSCEWNALKYMAAADVEGAAGLNQEGERRPGEVLGRATPHEATVK